MTQALLNLHVEEATPSGAQGPGGPDTDRPAVADKPKKRIQITTLTAYYELLPKLPMREKAVLEGLKMYHLGIGEIWPTAYELYTHMERRNEAVFDINSVRPVLTRLKDKGLVEFGKRRRCAVTGKSAYVWKFVESIQMALWPPPTEE